MFIFFEDLGEAVLEKAATAGGKKEVIERESASKREQGQAGFFWACASSHLSAVVLLWDNAQQSSCVALAPSTPPTKPELANQMTSL